MFFEATSRQSAWGRVNRRIAQRYSLSPRETVQPFAEMHSNAFTSFMENVRNTALRNEVGIDYSILHPTHLQYGSFARNLVVDMDGYFDTHRSEFRDLLQQGGQAVFDGLMEIKVEKKGQTKTVGELFSLLREGAEDESLYPNPLTRQLLLSDIDELTDNALKGAVTKYEKDPLSLSRKQVMDLKRVYDTTFMQLVFDLECGQFVQELGYFEARRKYAETAFAWQFRDDIGDFRSDLRDGVANLLTTFAQANNEFYLLTLALQKDPSFSIKTVGSEAYYRRIYDLAPISYLELQQEQQKVLNAIDMPIVTGKAALMKFA